MRATFAVTLSILLLLLSACAPRVNDPADVQAIKKSLDDYTKAVNAGDVEAIIAGMTDKVFYAAQNLPAAVGKDANRSLYKTFFSLFKVDLSLAVEDVRVAGDLAVARGTWKLTQTPIAQGLAKSDNSGSWITVYARQSDGSWKWDWCVPNGNQPLPGSTASGEDERALYQIERDWAEASIKNDAAALDKILASDFQANYGDFVGNKKKLLADLKSGKTKTESNVNSEMRAFVLGSTGIVNGLATVKSSLAGKDTSGQWRYTDVFTKREGRWQCVNGYSTKVQ